MAREDFPNGKFRFFFKWANMNEPGRSGHTTPYSPHNNRTKYDITPNGKFRFFHYGPFGLGAMDPGGYPPLLLRCTAILIPPEGAIRPCEKCDQHSTLTSATALPPAPPTPTVALRRRWEVSPRAKGGRIPKRDSSVAHCTSRPRKAGGGRWSRGELGRAGSAFTSFHGPLRIAPSGPTSIDDEATDC